MFKFKKIALIASVFTATALSLAAFAACGADGKDGVDGKDGKDGKDGVNGTNGVDGKDGVSITDAKIDENGDLIITLSDETTKNAGKVWKEDETPVDEDHVHIVSEDQIPLTYVKNMQTGDEAQLGKKVGDRITALYKCEDPTCNVVIAQETHLDFWNAERGAGKYNRPASEYAAGWDFTLPAGTTTAKDNGYLKSGVVAADRTCYIRVQNGTSTEYNEHKTETLTLIGYDDIYDAEKNIKDTWKSFTIDNVTYYTNVRSSKANPTTVEEALSGKGWVLTSVNPNASCNVKTKFEAAYYDYALNADETKYDVLAKTAISYYVDGINTDHFYDITQGRIIFAKEITDQDGTLKADSTKAKADWTDALELRKDDLPTQYVSAAEMDEIGEYNKAYYMVVCSNCTANGDEHVKLFEATVTTDSSVKSCDTAESKTVVATYAFKAGDKDIVSTRQIAAYGEAATGHVYQIYDQNSKPQYLKNADGKYDTTATTPVTTEQGTTYSYWGLSQDEEAIERTCLVCGATTTVAIPTADDYAEGKAWAERADAFRAAYEAADAAEREAMADEMFDLIMSVPTWYVDLEHDEVTATEKGDVTFIHGFTYIERMYVKDTALSAEIEPSLTYSYTIEVPAYGHEYDVKKSVTQDDTTEEVTYEELDYESFPEGTKDKAVDVVCLDGDVFELNVPTNDGDTVIITNAELTASTEATCTAPATKTITYTVIKRAVDKYDSNTDPVWKTLNTWTFVKTYEIGRANAHGSEMTPEVVAYPTNTNPGLVRYTCDLCGEVVEEVVLPAKNPSASHSNYGDTTETEPTCTDKGIITYTANEGYVVFYDKALGDAYNTNEVNMLVNSEDPYYDGFTYNTVREFKFTEDGKAALGHQLGAWRPATGSAYKWVRECQRTYANGEHYDGYIEVSNLDTPEA